MNTPSPVATSNARRTLIALAAIFTLPLLFAWLISIGPVEWLPVKTVNHGVLVKPPTQPGQYGVTDSQGAALNVNAIARDWYLVVLHSSACTQQCQDLMQIAATIKVAAGRDSSRITLVRLGPDDDVTAPAGERWILPSDRNFLQELGRASGQEQIDDALLIVDHRGRSILFYPPSTDGSGVLEDFKRLLRSTAR